jgi:hypothetical protein
MMSEHADLIHAAAYPVAYLRANIFGTEAALSRPLAVMLLGQKRYRTKVADLKRLLLDEREASRVREVAAHVLGRTTSPAAARALRAGLNVKDPQTLRSVVKALALGGDRSALPAIARLARRRGPHAATAAWAARLLRYRSGQGGSGLPKAVRWLRADPATAAPIAPRSASRTAVAQARRMLAKSAPSFAFSGTNALTFLCGDRRLMVLLDRDGVEAGLAPRMLARRALIGAVAEYSSAEGEAWEIAYLVLTEPRRRGNQVRMSVVTPLGRLVMDGTAVVKEDAAEFEIVAVDTPGAVPIEIAGTIAGGRTRFQRALVGSTRSRPLVPTLLERTA